MRAPSDIAGLVSALAERALARGLFIAAAESCTGGLIAAACTDLAGSSAWFERGFVTYSNEAKCEMLGVDEALIAAHGAVSEAVARAMAEGALRRSRAEMSVAVTGVAGPSGGSPSKPVGTVWLAWGEAVLDGPCLVHAECHHFAGDRAAVREATVRAALAGLLDRVTAP